MTGTEATLLKVGIAVIQRTVPTGIAFIKSWLKGKKVMVVGQSRSGKTTFIDYFQYGLFEDEKETFKTADVIKGARFNVKVGRDSALEVSVQSAIDVPGQVGATAHANEVIKNNPHAVIILTDLTTPLNGASDRASAAWLKEFCRRLESEWRAQKGKKNRIKTIIVLMNKRDKVNNSILGKRKQALRKILNAELHDARGQMREDIPIMPTVLVTNPDSTKSVDTVIAHLAKTLTR